MLVGDKNAAVQCLYDALDSSKNKVWSTSIKDAITKLLDICIDIRESESAKEALSQYRNICQILVGSGRAVFIVESRVDDRGGGPVPG